MDTYAHPSHDWERVEQLLEPSRSPARSIVSTNLPWLKQMLEQRNGILLLVSRKEYPYDTVGVIGISADGSAVIVHFYFVSFPYENSEALCSLYAAMITFALGRGATTLHLPVILDSAKPAHLGFFQSLATMHLDSPWESGHIVRSYTIPLDCLRKAIGNG